MLSDPGCVWDETCFIPILSDLPPSLPPSGCHSVRQPLALIFANFSALCESQSVSQSLSFSFLSVVCNIQCSDRDHRPPPPSICSLGPVLLDLVTGSLALMTLLKRALVVGLCWSISDRQPTRWSYPQMLLPKISLVIGLKLTNKDRQTTLF